MIGTAHDPDEARDLSAIADRVEQLDVTDPASIAALAPVVAGSPAGA